MNNQKAYYRKLNDGSHSSSTYHKKDGTPVRAILKDQLVRSLNNKTDDLVAKGAIKT